MDTLLFRTVYMVSKDQNSCKVYCSNTEKPICFFSICLTEFTLFQNIIVTEKDCTLKPLRFSPKFVLPYWCHIGRKQNKNSFPKEGRAYLFRIICPKTKENINKGKAKESAIILNFCVSQFVFLWSCGLFWNNFFPGWHFDNLNESYLPSQVDSAYLA